MMPRRSTEVHRQIWEAGYGQAGKATLFSAANCKQEFHGTACGWADHEKRHRHFLMVSSGHRSGRNPPRESPRRAHSTLQPVWMKVL